VNRGIYAKALTRRLVANTPFGPDLVDEPDLSGLPDWVVEAYEDQILFVSRADPQCRLWVVLPIDCEELLGIEAGLAISASPSSMLIYDDLSECVRVLAEAEYVGPYSKYEPRD